MLDILITATRRHEILQTTLESFKRNLFKDYPIKIIINIDPVGSDETNEDCLRVCQETFPKVEILSHSPIEPNFSKAFKWTWDQARTDYIFNLEDDWELRYKVDLQNMIDILERNKNLVLLRLPYFISSENMMINWTTPFHWNGEFFECPESLKMSLGFCGHPSLIKGEFVQKIAPYINTEINPEKQFHRGPPEIMTEVSRWSYGVYGQPNMPAYIHTLGEKWAAKTKWHKKGNKAWFLKWEK